MARQIARAFTKYAPLNEDFGRQFVERRFGPELAAAVLERMPRYQRGPKKGQLKGWVRWLKVEVGGWQSSGPSYHGSPNGRVLLPGARDVCVILDREGVFSFSPDSIASGLTLAQQIEYFERVVVAFNRPSNGLSRRY